MPEVLFDAFQNSHQRELQGPACHKCILEVCNRCGWLRTGGALPLTFEIDALTSILITAGFAFLSSVWVVGIGEIVW